MASEYLGMRLNRKKHHDIIKWLDRFDDRSEEARRLMSLAIRISKGEYDVKPKKSEPIVWNFPNDEVPIVPQKPKRIDVMANILSSFSE